MEREAPRDLLEWLERRESLERMGPRALMDPRGPLELQVREVWWVYLVPEEREACRDCRAQLVLQENQEVPELQAPKALLEVWVYQALWDHEEKLDQRELLAQKEPLVKMVL